MKSEQRVLLGFIVGAAAGIAAGMLLAPSAGKIVRKQIGDKANSLTHDLSDQLGINLDKLNDLKTTVLNSINEFTSKLADKSATALDKTKEAAEKAAQYGNQSRS